FHGSSQSSCLSSCLRTIRVRPTSHSTGPLRPTELSWTYWETSYMSRLMGSVCSCFVCKRGSLKASHSHPSSATLQNSPLELTAPVSPNKPERLNPLCSYCCLLLWTTGRLDILW